MKKLIIVLVIIGAVLGAVFAAATYYTIGHAGEIRAMALRAASERVGRDITAGALGGNPFTGFKVKDITVAGATPEAPKTLELAALRFRISLPALLRGKVVPGGLVLVRPTVRLTRSPDGRLDVQDVIDKLSKEPEPEAKPATPFDSARISDGTLVLTLERADADPLTVTVDSINAAVNQKYPDRTDVFEVSLEAMLESVSVSAAGEVRRGDDGGALDISFDTGKIDIIKPPSFITVPNETVAKYKIHGGASVSGKISGALDSPVIEAKAALDNAAALGHNLGGGSATAKLENESLAFSASVGTAETSLEASGSMKLGDKPALKADAKFRGFSAETLAGVLAPDAPPLLSGGVSGTAAVTGDPKKTDDLAADAIVTVKNGKVNYPSPSIHGQKDAWASIPFDTLRVTASHRQPNVTIKEATLAGPGVKCAASGTLKYSKDPLTGKPIAPFRFDFSATVDSPEVRDVLAHNPHLGPFLSGNLSARAKFAGRSDVPKSFTGNTEFSILKGTLANPYAKDSQTMPLNLNLSHFDFDSLAGAAAVADEQLVVRALQIRSVMINADVTGTLGFDGALDMRATGALPPGVVAQINDFRSALPKLGKIGDLKRVETSFDIVGDIRKPYVFWNVEDLLRREAERLIKKEAQRLLDKAIGKPEEAPADGADSKDQIDYMKDKLKKKLKDLF